MRPRSKRRVVFFSDCHFSDDPARNPGLTWAANSAKNLRAARGLDYDFAHFLGDQVDFNYSEYAAFRVRLSEEIAAMPQASFYGMPGNHEFELYKFPEITGRFPDDLASEVDLTLASPAKAGDTVLRVREPVSGVVAGHPVLLLSHPETTWPYTFEIAVAAAADTDQRTLALAAPLVHGYAAGDHARQGHSNERGIRHFREAFRGTASFPLTRPESTRHVHRVGNTLFIFLPQDHPHPWDPTETYAGDLSSEDMSWAEDLIRARHERCNVIVQTHVPPASGQELGTMDWTPSVCIWSPAMRGFFRGLCRRYRIPLWLSGHTHPNWRTGFASDHVIRSRPSGWGVTELCTIPSTAQLYKDNSSPEAQIVALDAVDGAQSLELSAYAVDSEGRLSGAPFRSEFIPLAHRVDLGAPEPG